MEETSSLLKRRFISDNYYIYVDSNNIEKEVLGHGAFASVMKCYEKGKSEENPYIVKKAIIDSDTKEWYHKIELDALNALVEKNIENAIKKIAAFDDEKEKELTEKEKIEGRKGEKWSKKKITYIVMELCKGGTLGDIIKSYAPLTENEIFHLMKPVVVCLSQMHKHNMIHRDIKPDNIMLVNPYDNQFPEKVKIRLIDFGVSAVKEMSLTSEKSGKFSAVSSVGSPAWMAPEIAKNKGGDSSMDVYSLGIIFYQLLYGTLPRELKEIDMPMESLYMTKKDQDTMLMRFPKCRPISVEIFDLIQRMIRLNPSERITCKQMLEHPFFAPVKPPRAFTQIFNMKMEPTWIRQEGKLYNYVEEIEKEEARKCEENPIFASNKYFIDQLLKSKK